MQRITTLMLIMFFLCMSVTGYTEQKGGDHQGEALAVMKEALQKRIRVTGTLDLFDVKADRVRNLRKIEFKEEVVNDGDQLVGMMTCKDIATNDMVWIEAVVLAKKEEALSFKEFRIAKIDKFEDSKAEIFEKKNVTREELITTMTSYVEQKSKFTKSFDLYDEKASKLRHLKLNSFSDKTRAFGSLHITEVLFSDVETNETLKIDMTVENKAGQLNVKKIKIKSVLPQ